jgi:hypothetical protein
MARRVCVPRLSEGSAASPGGGATKMFDPPIFSALRLVFGVGSPTGDAPDNDTFKPTYIVGVPVFSMGGLDPDGVYEFDAGFLLDAIRRRALRRRWGVRVEIELTQSAESVGVADLWAEAPFKEEPDGPGLVVLGRTGRGTTLPGGGRTIVVATTLATDSKRAALLSGMYNVQLRDTDPDKDEKPSCASLVRGIQVDLTHFEFEG